MSLVKEYKDATGERKKDIEVVWGIIGITWSVIMILIIAGNLTQNWF